MRHWCSRSLGLHLQVPKSHDCDHLQSKEAEIITLGNSAALVYQVYTHRVQCEGSGFFQCCFFWCQHERAAPLSPWLRCWTPAWVGQDIFGVEYSVSESLRWRLAWHKIPMSPGHFPLKLWAYKEHKLLLTTILRATRCPVTCRMAYQYNWV